MYNYKLQIQYDGGRYDGWQRLGKDSSSNTIEVKIKEIIKKITLIEKAVARHLPGVSIIVSKLAF